MRLTILALTAALVGCAPSADTIRVDASLEDGHPLRDTSRPFVGTDGAPGPELVTEEYLQRQISEKMADAIARPFAFMWTRAHWPSTVSRAVTDWPKREWGYRFHNAHGYATNVLEGQAYDPDFLFVSLPNPIYDGGDVKTGRLSDAAELWRQTDGRLPDYRQHHRR